MTSNMGFVITAQIQSRYGNPFWAKQANSRQKKRQKKQRKQTMTGTAELSNCRIVELSNG